MLSTSRNGAENGQDARASVATANSASVTNAEGYDHGQTGCMGVGESDQRTASYKVLSEATAYLKTLIPEGRWLAREPRIEFISEEGIAGSFKQGSDFIQVDTRLGVTRVVPHEMLHFWQSNDAFGSAVKEFFNREVREQGGNETVMSIVRDSMLEAGAYLFEAMFMLGPAAQKGAQYAADYIIKDLCESFSQDNGYTTLESVFNHIKRDELKEIAAVGIISATKKNDIDKAIEIASTNVGQALALLTLAANDYDAKRSFSVLASSPDEILAGIRNMNPEEVKGLMSRIERMAASEGKKITQFVDAAAETTAPSS